MNRSVWTAPFPFCFPHLPAGTSTCPRFTLASMGELQRVKHGMPGYRKGCRCDVCRQANTDRVMRAQRARAAREDAGDAEPVRRGDPKPPVRRLQSVDTPAPEPMPPGDGDRRAGVMESRVIAEIAALWHEDLWDEECETWEAQALDSARRIDDGAAVTHVAALSRLKNEAMRELRLLLKRPVAPSPADAADAERDETDEWMSEGHVPTAMCQPKWPVVVPGKCRFCDIVAARA